MEALAHSNEVNCPACHAPLELSRFTRIFGAFGGIAGGFVTLYLGQRIFQGWFWVTPVVAAILGFGFASALFVLMAGDLVVKPQPPAKSFPHPAK